MSTAWTSRYAQRTKGIKSSAIREGIRRLSVAVKRQLDELHPLSAGQL